MRPFRLSLAVALTLGSAVFLVSVVATAAPDEPFADTCDEAEPVVFPTEEEGIDVEISPVGDHDWYRFDVPGATDILVAIETVSGTVTPFDDDTNLTLWAACQAGAPRGLLAFGEDKPDDYTSRIVKGLSPGTYYLDVGGWGDASTATVMLVLEETEEPPCPDPGVQIVEPCEDFESFGGVEYERCLGRIRKPEGSNFFGCYDLPIEIIRPKDSTKGNGVVVLDLLNSAGSFAEARVTVWLHDLLFGQGFALATMRWDPGLLGAGWPPGFSRAEDPGPPSVDDLFQGGIEDLLDPLADFARFLDQSFSEGVYAVGLAQSGTLLRGLLLQGVCDGGLVDGVDCTQTANDCEPLVDDDGNIVELGECVLAYPNLFDFSYVGASGGGTISIVGGIFAQRAWLGAPSVDAGRVIAFQRETEVQLFGAELVRAETDWYRSYEAASTPHISRAGAELLGLCQPETANPLGATVYERALFMAGHQWESELPPESAWHGEPVNPVQICDTDADCSGEETPSICLIPWFSSSPPTICGCFEDEDCPAGLTCNISNLCRPPIDRDLNGNATAGTCDEHEPSDGCVNGPIRPPQAVLGVGEFNGADLSFLFNPPRECPFGDFFRAIAGSFVDLRCTPAFIDRFETAGEYVDEFRALVEKLERDGYLLEDDIGPMIEEILDPAACLDMEGAATFCHRPPGNATNGQMITVGGYSPLLTHIEHGDVVLCDVPGRRK